MRTEDSERWRRLEEVLEAALELPPEERAALLDEACGDDAELRAKAEAMLGHEASVADFMEGGALEAVAQAVAKERETWRQGERIGHYRIESLGR